MMTYNFYKHKLLATGFLFVFLFSSKAGLIAAAPSVFEGDKQQYGLKDSVDKALPVSDTLVLTKPENKVGKINIAFGSQNAQDVTSAVSYVFNRDIEKASVVTTGSALYGKLSGLHVSQPGGEPGQSSPKFYIRGLGTTDVYAPMVLVDGIERSMDQIPLEDVASVTVLKDASALAMYGLKGGNGVILVTTRKGFEGKTRVQVNMEYGNQTPIRLPNFIGSPDYARYYNQALVNDGSLPRYTEDEIKQFEAGTNPLYPNVNWFDQLLEDNAPIWKVGANFSGGDKTVDYFVSVNYLQNDGLYKYNDLNEKYNTNASYNRLNFRSNIGINITEDFTVRLNMAGHFEDRNYPGASAGEIFGNMYTYQPHLFPMLNPDGSIGGNGVYSRSPYGLITSTGFTEQHDRNLQTLLNANYKLGKLLEGLSFDFKASLDNFVRYQDTKSRTFAVYGLSGTPDNLIYTQYGTDSDLKYSSPTTQFNRWYIESGFGYERSFGESNVAATVLYNMGQYKDGSLHPYKDQGFAGRVNYGFSGKYLAEFSCSLMGAQNVTEENRWGFFPSGSLGWVVSKEDFLNASSVVNYLKVRGSYGIVGNDNTNYGRFLFNQTYSGGGGYYFSNANTAASGLEEDKLANPDVVWEKNYMLNVGVDGTIAKRIDFSVDYFSNRRTDILAPLYYAIPSYAGLSSGYKNYGEVTTQGIDFSLGWNDKAGDFDYYVIANGCFASSEVIKIGEPQYKDEYRSAVGNPVGQYFGFESVGFFKDQADIDASPEQFGSKETMKPGDTKYLDRNNDGVVDDNDIMPIGGSWFPEFTYGFNLGCSYKGFDVDAQFQGVENRTIVLSSAVIGPMGMINQIPEVVENSWTPALGNSAQYPRLTSQSNYNNYRYSSTWLKSGDFLRLRSFEVGYNLPLSAFGGSKSQKIRFFGRGMNLLTFDDLKIFDPEVQTGYPVMRSYHLGIKLDL